ncbi:MAG: amidohydrolase family protein [Xanthomonadales bacterium]|nr:amidohydrolase family protein [Xanthomonadales bacterium]
MRNFIISLIFLILLGATTTLQAQDLLIKNARIHTLSSAGILEASDLLIRNGKLSKIGKQLQAGNDTETIDAKGRNVTPGLFGGLSTIGLNEISLEDSTVDQSLDFKQMRPEFNVNYAYNPASSLIAINRIEGILYAVLSPLTKGSIFEGQGSPVVLDGRSFPQGVNASFISLGSAGKGDSGGSRAAQYMLLEQAFSEVTSGGDQNGPFQLLTQAGRLALKSRNNPYVFNVNRASDILRALEFIKANSLNGVISGAAEAWMVAAQLKAAGVPVIIDPLANLPASFDSLGSRLENAAILNAAGVAVIFSAGGAHNIRKIRQAAGNAVANGMPYAAAMAAITAVPAQVFAYAGGKLETGAVANLVIWDGDPLEVSSAADVVIIKGVTTPMVSRQSLLRDRYLSPKGDMPRAYQKP